MVGGCCAGFLTLRSGRGNLQNLLVQSVAPLEIEISEVLSICLVFGRKLSFLQSQFEHQIIDMIQKEVYVQIAENLGRDERKFLSKDLSPCMLSLIYFM